MKRSEILLMILHIPVDLVMLVLAAMSAYKLRFTSWAVELKPVIFTFSLEEFLSSIVWVFFAWIIIFALSGLYSTDPNRKFSRDLTRVFLASSTALAAIAVYVMFTQQVFDSRFLVATGWGFAIVYVSFGRFCLRGLKAVLYRAGVGLRRVILVGSDIVTQIIRSTLEQRPELGYAVVGEFPSFSEAVEEKILGLRPDEILLTNPRAKETEAINAINFCNAHHITFKYSADLFSTYSTNMSVQPIAGVPVVELRRTPLEGWGRVAKRVFDIVASIICILLSSPIMIVAAIVILFETGRPIIYKNERVGIRGRHFFTLKFRSMYKEQSTGDGFGGADAVKAEEKLIQEKSIKEGPVYKIKDDPRVTPFGRFIRRWSIDELPQFFNVLGGSMSIVGPRPHQPREVDKYQKHHKKVLILKPGITGLAQISGRSDLSFEDEVRLDVLYIEKWTLFLDLIIFLKTPFILFKRRKAL